MVPGLRWASWWAELPASPAVELGLRRAVGSQSFGPAPTALCQQARHRSKSSIVTSGTKTAALDPPPKNFGGVMRAFLKNQEWLFDCLRGRVMCCYKLRVQPKNKRSLA